MVIGGSDSGFRTAVVAANNGLKTAVVDENLLGGVQTMITEMPVSALMENERILSDLERSEELGIELDGIKISPETYDNQLQQKALAHSDRVVAELKDNDIDIYFGTPTARPDHSITVVRDDAGTRIFNWKKLVLANEDAAVIPRIIERDLNSFYTTDNYGLLNEAPDNLILYGSGLALLQAAQIWSHLGSHVIIISPEERVFDHLEPEIEKRYLNDLKERGSEIYTGSKLEEVYQDSSGFYHIMISDGSDFNSVIGEELMILTPQRASVSGVEMLNLDINDQFVDTDDYFRTSNKDVFTWTGTKTSYDQPELREEASDYLGELISGKTNKPFSPKGLIEYYDLNPPYYIVGDTTASGDNYVTGNFTSKDTFIEITIDPSDGELISGRVFGRQAREIANMISLFIQLEGSVEDFKDFELPQSPAIEKLEQAIRDAYLKI